MLTEISLRTCINFYQMPKGMRVALQPNYIYLPQVDSTNKYLKERAETLPDFSVCYSLNQYAGTGRRGHAWHGKGEGMLAVSFLLHSALLQDMPVLPLLCALCAVRVLK